MRDSAFPRLLRRWELDGDPGEHGLELRELPGGPTRRALDRELVVARELAAAGLPVLAPVPAADGRLFVTAQGVRYGLYPVPEGRPRVGGLLSIAHCRDLGELLGRIHRELARLLPPVQQTLLVPATPVAHAEQAVRHALAALPEPRDDLGSLAERHLLERAELLDELRFHRPPEVEVVTHGYLHGAFRPANVLYGKVGVVAVTGWRGLPTGPVATEVVSAAIALFADDRGLDTDRVRAFVAGHATAYPLDADQISSAAHRVWWELLCDVTDRPPLLAWWTQHLEDTLDAFAAAYRPVPDAAQDDFLEVS